MSFVKYIFCVACLIIQFNLTAQTTTSNPVKSFGILPGASQMERYLPLLKGKTVAVFANQTSMVGETHLVDTLLKKGIKLVKIFGPEHGFRGTADAGEELGNTMDKKTGIPIISLYGDHKKPTAADCQGVDILVFDIQDVGVRFYTYISSLQYYMEAALENHIPLLILDRPNPNGFYVDGPVLDTRFKSFIGMQPIPIVYGMTIGEYALMLAGEKWLSPAANAAYALIKNKGMAQLTNFFKIIPCKNYDHNSKYILPVAPSPNLREMQSIYLYPSTCFFEGTVLSEGRGTDKPFQIYGHPSLPKTLYAFTPNPNAGAKSSKCFNQLCYGFNLAAPTQKILQQLNKKIQLGYLLEAYRLFPGKDSFFLKNDFINKLAGNAGLAQQVKQFKTAKEIRQSWQPALDQFKKIRRQYLLYKDFE